MILYDEINLQQHIYLFMHTSQSEVKLVEQILYYEFTQFQ